MRTAPLRAVVDASVAVKIFVPEALSREARKLFVRFAQEEDAELWVPDLFFAECANVFWKWVRKTGYPVKDVEPTCATSWNLVSGPSRPGFWPPELWKSP